MYGKIEVDGCLICVHVGPIGGAKCEFCRTDLLSTLLVCMQHAHLPRCFLQAQQAHLRLRVQCRPHLHLHPTQVSHHVCEDNGRARPTNQSLLYIQQQQPLPLITIGLLVCILILALTTWFICDPKHQHVPCGCFSATHTCKHSVKRGTCRTGSIFVADRDRSAVRG